MDRTQLRTDFLAVLIYDDKNGCYSEEPRVYTATHPEIAYRLAVSDGEEERYGKRFIGLAYLDETLEDVPPIACSQKGEASEFVVDKQQLTAFSNPRWKGVPWDEVELADALRGPPPILEIQGLESVPWEEYSHAYGKATDVARDILGLVSTDNGVRESSLWQLFGSIYHQGSIYTATAVAVPFLLQIAGDARVPDRANVGDLLLDIANSSAIHEEKIRKQWKRRRDDFGDFYAKNWEENAEYEIESVASVRRAFADNIAAVRELSSDPDARVSTIGEAILENLETPLSPITLCSYCGGTGDCYCKRKNVANTGDCKRCKGSTLCHVCSGSGINKE
ncbi:hypothetical protein [Aeoliella sp.]|uniref:hypothetical protein n=1 Tax=Aeoliella sp. TaxID=2795800 RepID=UPI003CCC1703